MAVIPNTKAPKLRFRKIGDFAIHRRGDKNHPLFVVLRDGEFVQSFARLRDAKEFALGTTSQRNALEKIAAITKDFEGQKGILNECFQLAREALS